MNATAGLALFLKFPEPGTVKSRLTGLLGPDRAARFYWECALLVMAKSLRLLGTEVFAFVTPVEKQEWDVNEVVEAALSMIQNPPKAVRVEKRLGQVPKARINAGQIQRLVLNVCNNAFEAMPDGGVLTFQTSKAVKDGRDMVEIDVRDTGTGIYEENRSKIFDPFFTTKGEGKGRGLGLTLVYEIIGKHSGNIEVESEVGKGTTFKFFIPASDRQAA